MLPIARIALFAAVLLSSAGCVRPTFRRECRPGGRCSVASDAELTPVERALGFDALAKPGRDTPEVRVWQWDVLRHNGIVTQFVGRGDAVTAQTYEWWRTDDPLARERRRRGGGPHCDAPPQRLGHVAACRVRVVTAPYAANILRFLDRAHLRTLPGAVPPRRFNPSIDCAGDLCLAPTALVVEDRQPSEYRTYGYTLGVAEDSVSLAARGLSQLIGLYLNR